MTVGAVLAKVFRMRLVADRLGMTRNAGLRPSLERFLDVARLAVERRMPVAQLEAGEIVVEFAAVCRERCGLPGVRCVARLAIGAEPVLVNLRLRMAGHAGLRGALVSLFLVAGCAL